MGSMSAVEHQAEDLQTTHSLHLGDARELDWVPDSSVHLVITSPRIGPSRNTTITRINSGMSKTTKHLWMSLTGCGVTAIGCLCLEDE